MRRLLLVAVAALALGTTRGSAQDLSAADTVVILATSLEAHVDRRWLWREARVWLPCIEGPRAYDPPTHVVESLLRVMRGLRRLTVMRRDPAFRVSSLAEAHPYRDSAGLERVVGALRAAALPD